MDELLYFIENGAGLTYGLNDNGDVILTPDLRPIQYSPEGWKSALLKWGRNVSTWGIIRSFSEPLGFTQDGAKILRKLLYSPGGGIQAKGNLAIARMDPANLQHKKLFYGALDFSKYDDGKETFDISVTEGGLSSLLTTNYDTTYEISTSVPEAINVLMDGLIFKAKASYTVESGDYPGRPIVYLGLLLINTEGSFRDLFFNSVFSFQEITPAGFPNATSDGFVIRNSSANAMIFNLKLDYNVSLSGGADEVYNLGWSKSNGSVLTGGGTWFTSNLSTSPMLVDVQPSVTLNSGEQLYIFHYQPSGVKHLVVEPGGIMNVDFEFRFQPTTIKALMASYVFAQLISKATGGLYPASSQLLATMAKDFVVTCGDAMRGLPDAKIKTSIKDFFTAYNLKFNCGMGVYKNTAIFEGKAHFFNGKKIAHLGQVKNFHKMPAEDLLYSKFKVGYKNTNTEDVNGKFAFNIPHEYTTPITVINKGIDLTSNWLTDPYAIEILRLNLAGKDSTDDESDNDVIMLNVVQDGVNYILNRPNYTVLTGIPAGQSIFNMELSPLRCLLANGSFLSIGMHLQDAGQITYQTTAKNADVVTELDGVTYSENANVPIASLAPRLILPIELHFDFQAPVNMSELIDNEPFGYFTFEDERGEIFEGYILEIGQQHPTNGTTTCTLFATVNNDLSLFL